MAIVSSWIEQHALRRPDAEALVDLATGTTLSYSELWARVRAAAHGLESRHGVGLGQRVACLSRNDIRAFELMYACAPWCDSRSSQLATRAGGAGDDRRGLGAVTAARRGLDHRCCRRHGERLPGNVSGPHVGSDRDQADDYEDLATLEAPSAWRPEPVADTAVRKITYTSGTTGRPKGVQTTHRAVLASCSAASSLMASALTVPA